MTKATDIVSDGTGGTFTQVWECEPPAEGSKFRVLRDEWSEDYTVRTIFEWEAA